ncbi:MAG TPA: hypothetical protein VG502_05510 [Flexivirga sp.]|uniref:hypothetical protein n=1 Tax=Flexivirga sp. TaxID=1962927 RepID=UPI002C2BEA7E|nr:hypothetical protein [Flexivirga sp.]HWC21736.1 hypothetical protein [Flexivirga sp.]
MVTTAHDVRAALLEQLMGRVEEDRFPSTTMLDMIEQLLTPDDVPGYARLLLDKAAADNFPSITMLRRVQELTR